MFVFALQLEPDGRNSGVPINYLFSDEIYRNTVQKHIITDNIGLALNKGSFINDVTQFYDNF